MFYCFPQKKILARKRQVKTCPFTYYVIFEN